MIDRSANDSRSGYYRAYSLDAAGRIFGVEVIQAKDDAQACQHVRAMAKSQTFELWDRARFLGIFKPDAAAPKFLGDFAD